MLLNVPLFRPSPPVSLLLTSSCFYILWHLAQRLYVCSIVLCSTLNLPSLSLVSNRVAWSSPPSGFLWQVLLGADTVLACSPVHQSPACGIGEQRKAPPWEMPVKTLFHPVLLSLSLLFLVSYEHLTLRSLVALSFLTVLIRSMPQEDGRHEPRYIQYSRWSGILVRSHSISLSARHRPSALPIIHSLA